MGTLNRSLRLGLTVLALAVPVAAQPPELVTDRPDQTESAEVVPEGSFQIEAGWLRSETEDGPLTVTTEEIPGTLVRIGVAEALELRLGWGGWVTEEIAIPGVRQETDGLADADIGLKWRFAQERGRRPQMALLASASIPSGEEGLSSERVDPAARVAFAHTLSETVGLGYNLGIEWSTELQEDRQRTTRSSAIYTVATGFGLTPTVGAFVELFGDIPMSAEGDPAHSFDGGFTFLLGPRLQLDVAAGVGLNDAAEDWFAGVGVSYRRDRRP